LFNVAGDTSAPPTNAAWSGTLLFSLFNSNQGFRLMSTGDGESVDTLNDWRDALFAYASYRAGFGAAVLQVAKQSLSFPLGDPVQNARDASILGSTWGSFVSSNGWTSFFNTLLSGSISPALTAAFNQIELYGQRKILDMLRGSYYAQSFGDTVSDAAFKANAFAFAQQLGLTGQSLQVRHLSASEILAGAMAAGPSQSTYIAALVALSPFVITNGTWTSNEVKLVRFAK
jgi:hypothetical protein